MIRTQFIQVFESIPEGYRCYGGDNKRRLIRSRSGFGGKIEKLYAV